MQTTNQRMWRQLHRMVQKTKEMTEETIYTFDDWLCFMPKSTEYTMFDLLCFEEHYQNLLTFEQNTEIFIKQL